MAKRALLISVGVIVVAFAAFAIYTWMTLSYAYSEGERAGYLQKFSKKGWICKTWEGEILLSSMPGAIPERFEFSVRSDEVAAQLSAAAGKRVVITYAQRKGVPSSCFGETEYFVEKVTINQ